MKFTLFVYH